jgi:hypothetical protein
MPFGGIRLQEEGSAQSRGLRTTGRQITLIARTDYCCARSTGLPTTLCRPRICSSLPDPANAAPLKELELSLRQKTPTTASRLHSDSGVPCADANTGAHAKTR